MSTQDSTGHSMTEALLALDSCRPTTAQHHKGDWSQVTFPLKPDMWEKALESHPDWDLARLMCLGRQYGFRVGFNYHTSSCKPGKGKGKGEGNIQSVSQHRDVV